MASTVYDVIIGGSGPLAASTAYFLSKHSGLKVAVISKEPETDGTATYKSAGGSIRYIWPDPEMETMTQETAAFAREVAAKGVDLKLLEDHYWLLHRGQFIPSLNISGLKLVEHLLGEAMAAGVEVIQGAEISAVTKDTSGYQVATTKGNFSSKKAVLALGVANNTLLPEFKFDTRTRQLYILDVPVTEQLKDMPHTVVPMPNGGFVFTFIKNTPDGLKFILGQEDIVGDDEVVDGTDYFQQILDSGVAVLYPFLKTAKVEKIWWGYDMDKKLPLVQTKDEMLFTVNCGSAVRSCIFIGRTMAERLVK